MSKPKKRSVRTNSPTPNAGAGKNSSEAVAKSLPTSHDTAVKTATVGDPTITISRKAMHWTAAGVISSLLATFITSAFLFFGYRQTRNATQAAISQAQTSKSEFEASERAWVSMKVTTATLTMVNGSARLDPVAYTLNDAGHSVATHLGFQDEMIFATQTSGRYCDFSKQNVESWGEPGEGQVIFPNETFNGFGMPGLKFKGDMAKQAAAYPNSHNYSFKLVACVIYMSPTDHVLHHTRRTYWVVSDDAKFTSSFPLDSGTQKVHLLLDPNGTHAD